MAVRSLRGVPLLALMFAVALPSLAAAQFPPPPAPVQDRWPDATRPQAQTAPVQQAAPANPAPQSPASQTPEAAPARAPKTKAAATPATTVVCGGIFAKDSTHLKIAIKYDSRNVVFGEVNGPDNTKINATIVYPNDPKRRLEVVWNNDTTRTDMQVISINGQSRWIAPKGLKLGLALAALEKTNGRPFKLTGFSADGIASVLDWQGGALEKIPGDCKIGLRLAPGGDVPDDAREALAADKEIFSSDGPLRAVKPTVSEILIGY